MVACIQVPKWTNHVTPSTPPNPSHTVSLRAAGGRLAAPVRGGTTPPVSPVSIGGTQADSGTRDTVGHVRPSRCDCSSSSWTGVWSGEGPPKSHL